MNLILGRVEAFCQSTVGPAGGHPLVSKELGFSAFVSCHNVQFLCYWIKWVQALWRGPCKLFFLVVSQCCSQICVITRYICLIYKITASWQLCCQCLACSYSPCQNHYEEAPAGCKGWSKQSHVREPEYNQDLLVKLLLAVSSPGCSVFPAISSGEEDPSVTDIRECPELAFKAWFEGNGLEFRLL